MDIISLSLYDLILWAFCMRKAFLLPFLSFYFLPSSFFLSFFPFFLSLTVFQIYPSIYPVICHSMNPSVAFLVCPCSDVLLSPCVSLCPRQLVTSAVLSLQMVYPRRNLPADQWRRAQLLSLLSAPANMLDPARCDTVSGPSSVALPLWSLWLYVKRKPNALYELGPAPNVM